MGEENLDTLHGEFLLNKETKEIHHIPFATKKCRLGAIRKSIQYFSLTAARKLAGADLCAHCFKSRG